VLTGASLTAPTLIVVVATLLDEVPSVTLTVTVRGVVSGASPPPAAKVMPPITDWYTAGVAAPLSVIVICVAVVLTCAAMPAGRPGRFSTSPLLRLVSTIVAPARVGLSTSVMLMSLSLIATTAGIIRDGRSDMAGELREMRAASEHARRAGARRGQALALANLADAYLKDGQYATALDASEQALPLAREIKDLSSETVALANIGLARIGLGQIAEGTRSVRAAIAIDERRGSPATMSGMLRELGDALERAGDLKGALGAYQEHRALADEVYRKDQQQAILELQEQFDNERRLRELDLLNRENRLKGETLRSQDLQRLLWGLMAGAAVLLMSVVVMLMRRVRQTNIALASSNELLKVQSERDPLTGLANRRHFQAAMRELSSDGCLAGTAFLIDIDHFKRINDTWGHASGDRVLVEIARRLREALREQDLLVRWGGEEFLVVVRQLAPEQVEALARRLLSLIGDTPVQADGRSVPVTASIGFATFPLEPNGLAVPWERAINLVDTAMYLAKAHGRNRAYGVRQLNADSLESFERIGRLLEQSWQTGQVVLSAMPGPVREEQPA